MAVQNNDGSMTTLPVSALGQFIPSTAPQQINRIDTQRSISFSVTPPPEVPLEQAVNDIEGMIDSLEAQNAIPPTVTARTAGSADKLNEVRTSLLGAWTGFNLESLQSLATSRMFLALLIVFLVMAALFESFLYPLVILLAVPLATVGGFMGLSLAHWANPAQQLDTLTMLGFVILIGVVVNNAILIVHQALNFMRPRKEEVEPGKFEDIEPMPPREAIRESVRSRIRPIFMTTTTSVCGMLPLVLMGGSGSELYKGLGSVVVGGLLVATLFTLVVVPLLLSLVIGARRSLVGGV
jgi:HAE1 family hydrophobic/amphiphilic exporter-1